MGVGDELLKQRVLSEVECSEIENGKGSETSMKDFAIKVSMSEMVLLGQGLATFSEQGPEKASRNSLRAGVPKITQK